MIMGIRNLKIIFSINLYSICRYMHSKKFLKYLSFVRLGIS